MNLLNPMIYIMEVSLNHTAYRYIMENKSIAIDNSECTH